MWAFQRWMAQHMKISHSDTLYIQTKRKKAYDHLIRYRKDLWQNPTPLHEWSPGVIRDTREILKHNKGNLQQVCGHHQIKWRKAIPLKLGQSCPLPPCLCNIVLKPWPRARRQLKEIKGIQIENEEVKVSSFLDDTIVYTRNLKIPAGNSYSW